MVTLKKLHECKGRRIGIIFLQYKNNFIELQTTKRMNEDDYLQMGVCIPRLSTLSIG